MKIFLLLYILNHFLIQSNSNEIKTDKNNTRCPPLRKLDILPGFGWDPLRNLEMSQVIEFTYNECKTTLDGKYLIPDHTYTIPLRNSIVELSAEIIDNWSDFKSVTSRSMGISAGGAFHGISASGTYSEEYQTIKQKQIDEKSITTRVVARYSVYKVGIELGAIAPELKSSLLDAIDAIKGNNTEKKMLILELVTRDYGTHYSTWVVAGALILKEDFILRQFADTYVSDKHVITAAASASFFGVVNFGANYQSSSDVETTTKYEKSTSSSKIHSMGGDLFKPNTTVDKWIDSIPQNLVSIDRAGDPLYYLITPKNFPGIPLNILSQLRNGLQKAITEYNLYNSHLGCIDPNSPWFDYNANIEKSCEKSTNNYTFGGVYQTCIAQGDDLCAPNNLTLRNVITGQFSCQSPYTAVVLKEGTVTSTRQECYESCESFLFWDDCDTNCYNVESRADYTAYWCAATGAVETVNTGVMFGGLYTSKIENPLTHAYSCPPTFFNFKILRDLHVCLGNDYELGFKYSAKFGGFFSCQNGNPLADILKNENSKKLFEVSDNQQHKACPPGYSQHTAIIEDGCEVNYCVLADSFRIHDDIPIRLPPFRNFSAMFSQNMEVVLPGLQISRDSNGKRISRFGIGAIVVGACAGVGLIFVMAGVILKIRRSRTRSQYNEVPSAELEWDNSGERLNLLPPGRDISEQSTES